MSLSKILNEKSEKLKFACVKEIGILKSTCICIPLADDWITSSVSNQFLFNPKLKPNQVLSGAAFFLIFNFLCDVVELIYNMVLDTTMLLQRQSSNCFDIEVSSDQRLSKIHFSK